MQQFERWRDVTEVTALPSRRKSFRWLELDGALLGFDRDTGRNLLLRGDETSHFVQRAPRVVQLALTNACNKTCGFCYRPLDADSRWTFEGVVELARFLDRWGVMELAVGGGEPTVFPRFVELVTTLHERTRLAINFTTNGRRLTRERLAQLRPSIGQVQLSVYDDEDTDARIALLTQSGVRFGLNYLVTPSRLKTLDEDILRWSEAGAREVMLLSYKGDEGLHLSPDELARLDDRIVALHSLVGDRVQLKVDVCWGARLANAPQMFFDADCRAGALFLSVTSDRRVLSCSFADGGIAFERPSELPAIYQSIKRARQPAHVRGCLRYSPLVDRLRLPVVRAQPSYPELVS